MARGKKWTPTDEERNRIKLYIGLGLTQEQCAVLIGQSVDSLSRHCRKELDQGKAEILAKVAGNLVQKALAGDTASTIFYLKTQGGWRERVDHTHADPNGGPVQFVIRDLTKDD